MVTIAINCTLYIEYCTLGNEEAFFFKLYLQKPIYKLG